MNFILAVKKYLPRAEPKKKSTSTVEAIFGVQKFKSFYDYQKICIDCIIYDEEKKDSYKSKSLNEYVLLTSLAKSQKKKKSSG